MHTYGNINLNRIFIVRVQVVYMYYFFKYFTQLGACGRDRAPPPPPPLSNFFYNFYYYYFYLLSLNSHLYMSYVLIRK